MFWRGTALIIIVFLLAYIVSYGIVGAAVRGS